MSHAATARMPLAVSFPSLDASRVSLGHQMAIPILRRPVFSAWLASTQRQGTVATALAAQVVASHQLLVAQRLLRAICVSRVSTAPRGHRRVHSARLVERMRTSMPRLSALSVASGRTLDVARRRVMSV